MGRHADGKKRGGHEKEKRESEQRDEELPVFVLIKVDLFHEKSRTVKYFSNMIACVTEEVSQGTLYSLSRILSLTFYLMIILFVNPFLQAMYHF